MWSRILSRAGVRLLREVLAEATSPGPIYVLILEEPMANQFRCAVLLQPPQEPGEVVERELTVVVNGGDPSVEKIDPSLASKEYVWPQDAVVAISAVDLDDAGNRSAPRELTVVIRDTIAPVAPGEFGVQVIEEL